MINMEKKQKPGVQFAIFAVTFFIAFFVAKIIFSKNTNEQLEEIAESLNAKTPLMLDAETRLDHVKVLADTLQYEYTLINVDKNDTTTNVAEAKQFLMKQSQANLDSSPEMEEYRKKNISLNYHYRDKNGQELLEFNINPSKEK